MINSRTVRYNTTSAKRPDIDTGFALNTIWTVTTIIENALLANGTFFLDLEEKVYIADSEFPRYSRHQKEVGRYRTLGRTRAHKSLFYPLEGLEEVFATWSTSIGAWAMRAKHMRETTLPFLDRQRQTIENDAEYVSILKTALHENGTLDHSYVNNFRVWARLLKVGLDDVYGGDGLLPELRRLASLLRSICEDGNSNEGFHSLEQIETVSPRCPPQQHSTVTPLRTGKTDRRQTTPKSSDKRRSSSTILPSAIPARSSSRNAPTEALKTHYTSRPKPVTPSSPPQHPLVTTTKSSHNIIQSPPKTPHPPPATIAKQWLLSLSHRHHPSSLIVHPRDMHIYHRASYLANTALVRLQRLIREVEGYVLLAEEMRVEYEIWTRKVGGWRRG